MGGLSGIISGLVGSGQGENTIDMSALLSTIQGAGQYQQSIINALPPEIQQNLATYAQANGVSIANLTNQVNNQTQAYSQGMNSIYGPNSAAATAQKSANTQAAYAPVQGTQNAIRNALAATGGLSRGNAGVALAQPYVAAAQQSGQANANVNAQQTSAAQGAAVQALNTVNSMDANLFQTQFGLSQAQAQQILTSGNQALQQQLIQLIQQSQTQTNQTLGVQGVAATNAFNNAQQQSANQNAIYSGLGNLAVQGATSFLGGGAGSTMSGLPSGADVSSPNYQMNMYQNAPAGSY